MDTIHVRETVEKDGEVHITGLPVRKGQSVEMILLIEPSTPSQHGHLTARQFLQTGLIGLWQDRNIPDSAAFARQLRDQAQRRWNQE